MSGRDIFFWIGVVFSCICALVMAIAAFRIKSDESWHGVATRRGEELKDARKEVERLTARNERLEQDNELCTSGRSRDRAKVDWYETRYGPIAADKHLTE